MASSTMLAQKALKMLNQLMDLMYSTVETVTSFLCACAKRHTMLPCLYGKNANA